MPPREAPRRGASRAPDGAHRAAARRRAPPVRVRGAPRRLRSLAAVAVENAVEGCVRETFGALTASWQAAHARDPHIARTMARIARDETRHAALAWAIARWVEPRLDARARRRIVAARRRAVRTLRRQARAAVPATLVRQAGVPPRHPTLRGCSTRSRPRSGAPDPSGPHDEPRPRSGPWARLARMLGCGACLRLASFSSFSLSA